MSDRKSAPDPESLLAQAIQSAFHDRLPAMHCYRAASVQAVLKGDWSVDEVLIGLHREAEAGRLQTHFSCVDQASVFWRVPPHLEMPGVPATPTLAANIGSRIPLAAPAGEAAGVLRQAGIGDVDPRAPMPSHTADPLSLRHRIREITVDLEDAIGDACDCQLPHAALKALAAANGAMQRALRTLAA